MYIYVTVESFDAYVSTVRLFFPAACARSGTSRVVGQPIAPVTETLRLLCKVAMSSRKHSELPQSTPIARFLEPMLCPAVEKLPEGPAWQYEVKLDGYRAIRRSDKYGCRALVSKQKGFLAPFSKGRAGSGRAASRDRSRW